MKIYYSTSGQILNYYMQSDYVLAPSNNPSVSVFTIEEIDSNKSIIDDFISVWGQANELGQSKYHIQDSELHTRDDWEFYDFERHSR